MISKIRTVSNAKSAVSTEDRVLDTRKIGGESTVSSPISSRQTARDLLLIFLLSLPLFFLQMGSFAFFDPDEGRYAEIPREMLANADWLTPTLNYVKYFEKPPLFYWLVAGSFKIFGINETAARLVPALLGLLGLVLTYALARRMFGRRAGLLSAFVLATTLFWPIMARQVIIDLLLSVTLFAASAFWWLGQTEEHAAPRRWYFAAFWVSLALAFLSKGPVAALLTGVSILLYIAICRQWKNLRSSGSVWGLPLCIAIVAPWFVLVALKNPEFNHYFWWGQNFARFLGIGKNREHVQSATYFLQFLPLLFFPWTFLVPAAIANGARKLWPARRDDFSDTQRAAIYLLCNAAFIVLFFSTSTSKLVTYVLPAFPPLAILLSVYLEKLLRQRDFATHIWAKIGTFLLTISLLILGIAGILLASITRSAILSAKTLAKIDAIGIPQSLLLLVGTALLLWAGALFFVLWKRQSRALIAVYGGGFALFLMALLPVLTAIAPQMTAKSLVAQIQPGLDRGATLTLFDNYTQGANFYSKSRLVNIGREGEIWFGASLLPPREKAQWFPKKMATLQKIMSGAAPVYCLVSSHRAAQEEILPQLGGNAVEIAWNNKHSVIGNKAAAALTLPVSAPPNLGASAKSRTRNGES